MFGSKVVRASDLQGHKPRFNRSNPRVVHGNQKKTQPRNFGPDKAVRWRVISTKTLGYLAATGKVTILQVHHLIGDKADKGFIGSFLDAIDLHAPTEKDMVQIHLFSHLLFS